MEVLDSPLHYCTELWDYTHEQTKSHLSLVGMMHIADPEYYQQVQQEIDQRQLAGSLVHYEMVVRTPAQVLAVQSRPTQRKVIALRTISKRISSLSRGLGLASQKDSLEWHEDWKNHDATELQVALRMSPTAYQSLRAVHSIVRFAQERWEPHILNQMMVSALEAKAQKLEKPENPKSAFRELIAKRYAVVDYRNIIAATAVRQALSKDPDTDITLVWGQGHLPGIGERLEAMGYTLNDKQRLEAINIERLKERVLS